MDVDALRLVFRLKYFPTPSQCPERMRFPIGQPIFYPLSKYSIMLQNDMNGDGNYIRVRTDGISHHAKTLD